MKQTLTLNNFPRPDVARTLSPNGTAHHMAKARARKGVHEHVKVLARFDLQPMRGMVTLRPTFVFPVKRNRDDDNFATGVMKAVRDGLVKAGYLEADDSDHLRQERVEMVVEKGRRALILEFEYEAVNDQIAANASGQTDAY